MLKPIVEQCVDKSVKVYLGGLVFKRLPMESWERPEWKSSEDQGYETVESPFVIDWLNRLWFRKIYCAPNPPGPIRRFPRRDAKRVKRLMRSAENAYETGDAAEMDAIAGQLKSLVTIRQPPIDRWKDLPLASEAPEQKLKWLAKGRIPLRQVTVIAASKDIGGYGPLRRPQGAFRNPR